MIRKGQASWTVGLRWAGIAVALGALTMGCERPTTDGPAGAASPEASGALAREEGSDPSARRSDADGGAVEPVTVVRRVGADLSGPLKAYEVQKVQDNVRVVILELSRQVIFAQSNDPLVLGSRETGLYATPAVQVRYMVEFLGQETIRDYSASVDRLTVGNVPLEAHPEVAPGATTSSSAHESTGPGGFRAPRAGNPTRAAIQTATFRGLTPAAEAVDVSIEVVKNGQSVYFDFGGLPL